MPKASWLHISDMHIFKPSPDQEAMDFDRKKVLKAFLKFIKDCEWKNFQKPQFVVVTGDLAFCASTQNYFEGEYCVIDFLKKLLEALGYQEKEYADRIFPVAGNHDVSRDNLTDIFEKPMIEIAKNQNAINQLLTGSGSYGKKRQIVLERLSNYSKFYKELKNCSSDKAINEILWYAEKIKVKVVDKPNLWILGLCSSWLCQSEWAAILNPQKIDRAESTDYLTLGEAIVKKRLSEVKDSDLILTLMHHDCPISVDPNNKMVEKELYDKPGFILLGHEHSSRWAEPINGNVHKVWAGCLYESSHYRNAFNIVEVDVDANKVKMQTIMYREDCGWVLDHYADPTQGKPKMGYKFEDGLLTFPLTYTDECKEASDKPILPLSPKSFEEDPQIHNYEDSIVKSLEGDVIQTWVKRKPHISSSGIQAFLKILPSAQISITFSKEKQETKKRLAFGKNLIYQVLQEDSKDVLPESPILYLSELTDFAQIRRYGIYNKKTRDFLNKKFDPDSSYMFVSPRKTGKSTLLTLLACAVIDKKVKTKRDYIFVKIWQHDLKAPVSIQELFDIIKTTKEIYDKSPVLLVDNITSQKGLLRALRKLRKQSGADGRTPIWATELTDNLSKKEDINLTDLEKLLNPIHDLPGVLHTSEKEDIEEFLKRVVEMSNVEIREIYDKVLKKNAHVTPLYLGSLWKEGNELHYDLKVLEDALLRIPFDPMEIFKGIYGEQVEVGKSAINIACYLNGISYDLLIKLTDSANGMSCQQEIDKLFAGSVLREIQNMGVIQNKKGTQYVDGIQDVALFKGNFPPARRKEVLMCLLHIDSDDPSFGEAIIHLDQHYGDLSYDARRLFFDKLLNSPLTEEIFLVASHHIDDCPKLLDIWQAALKMAKNEIVWGEILSGFGVALLAVEKGPDSITCLEKAVTIAPKDYRLQLTLAKAYMKCFMWTEAHKQYEQILPRAYNNREAISGYYNSARKQMTISDFRARFEELTIEYPQSAWIAGYTGYAWGTNEPKNWPKAVKFHEKAVELAPNEKDIVTGLYYALKEVG
ncbi:MAG: hypothetical protein GY845_37050, partial [Planctomycetes bacterium]|nr:hypothetical protein [Planctomycetota bacterium]